MLHLLPSGQLIPDPSQTPFRSFGPPLGVKSTNISLPLTIPSRDHALPLPSAGHPGEPSVPLSFVEDPFIEIMRLQLGWNGSSYDPEKSTALAVTGAIVAAAPNEMAFWKKSLRLRVGMETQELAVVRIASKKTTDIRGTMMESKV